ncbi:PLP-dependent aminotransferase family protein [Aneurinibacillus terranovensis]|uniref:aminotransferase-like domain-containing protein n=1 Tax=Aneurinibacillus terranovensis TaxID=278991 RepID=UPI00041E375A|nr:PLP-dependent aminotransferase family protein [Aneurinibacillus terranovensis]
MSIPYFRLHRSSRVPLSKQIAEQLVHAIRARLLKPGQSLPTVRQLSSNLQVSLETVQKAYHTLKKDGWIESRPHHGTRVTPTLPPSLVMLPPHRGEKRTLLLTEMKKYRDTPGILPVSGVTLPPDRELMRAFQQEAGAAVELAFIQEELEPFGLIPLRSRIQGLLAARGFWAEEKSICIVSGTQQALWLITDQFIKPGDIVGVPEMCYLPARDVFRDRGARIVPIKLGSDGIDVEHLMEVCRREPLAMLYAMPNAHYPTGASWTHETKQAVLTLAVHYGFKIIEDEYFGELYYSPLPPSTLYSLAKNGKGQSKVPVFYMSSFSTITHPNLRLGYMVVPEAHTERLERAKYLLDSTTSVISQQLLLNVWERVNIPEYLAGLRATLKKARDAMIDSLTRWTPDPFSFNEPAMGVCTWVYAPGNFTSMDFFEQCLARHVYVMPADAFAVEDPVPGFQVKFGSLSPQMLDEGLRRIGEVLGMQMANS